MTINRRQFLAHTAAGAALIATSGCNQPAPSHWQQQHTNTAPVQPRPTPAISVDAAFAGTTFTNQDGQPFHPAAHFGQNPFIVIFGFKDCDTLCTGDEQQSRYGIAHAVTEMQKTLQAQGKNIPIVLVDTLPNIDRRDARAHVAEYTQHGLIETTADGIRQFHILYADNPQWVEELQTQKLGLLQDTENHLQHSAFAVLFVGGRQQKFTENGIEMGGLRSIPRNPLAALREFHRHGADIARQFIDRIDSLSAQRIP